MGGAGAMTHGTRAMTGGVRAVMCNATAKGTSGVKGGTGCARDRVVQELWRGCASG